MVERRSPKPRVGGSNPSCPANLFGIGSWQPNELVDKARNSCRRFAPRCGQGVLPDAGRGGGDDHRGARHERRLRDLPLVADWLIVGGTGHREGVRLKMSRARRRRPERKWYIVHTYSGFEERVKETLRQRAEALGMGEAFGEIRIPTETVVEYKGGKKRETQRKFFPGYILVEMEMSDEAWHVVKYTPKVTGFVGTGKKPTPLSEDEVDKILEQVVTAKEKPKPKYMFEKAEP